MGVTVPSLNHTIYSFTRDVTPPAFITVIFVEKDSVVRRT